METKEKIDCLNEAMGLVAKAAKHLEDYCEYPIVNNVLQGTLNALSEIEWAIGKVKNESL